ncbi:MAG TPA: nickel pincer cofactor biosynthesis protein LarC [Bacillota bacterium]|nr:nickel pincer cofactor biosynthesis protein LarC [Bacillota bacterium]
MKQLYFDCPTGAAGDMLLSSLLDAGVDEGALRASLARLPLADYTLKIGKTNKKGLSGTSLTVLPGESHQHCHRHLADILELISQAGLSPWATNLAGTVFRRLAEAEAKVHGTSPERVHFHEVGGVDSIIDIIGFIVALELLAPDRITCSPLPVGNGFVKCEHGLIPVPAPATLELLKGIPLKESDLTGELVTPTAAALLSTVVQEWTSFPALTVDAVGYGAGTRELRVPNLLRAVLGSTSQPSLLNSLDWEKLLVIETNLDDLNPEILPYVADKCLGLGALDVYYQPVIMKKGRSGSLFTVVTKAERADLLCDMLFRETSTLGVRINEVSRYKLPRSFTRVTTPFGEIQVKTGHHPVTGEQLNVAPEFEDCRRAASAFGAPLKAVYQAALDAFRVLNS